MLFTRSIWNIMACYGRCTTKMMNISATKSRTASRISNCCFILSSIRCFFINSIELCSCLNDHFSIKSIENTNDMLLFSIASAIKECKIAFFSKLRRLLNYPLSAHDLISGDKLKLNGKKIFSEYSSPKKPRMESIKWISFSLRKKHDLVSVLSRPPTGNFH